MIVVIKQPGRQAEIRAIGEDLDAMQAVIAHGDYSMIEHITDGPDGLDLWANEEAKYAQDKEGRYLEANIWIFDMADVVLGTVFVAAHDDEGETLGLTPDECTRAINWLESRALRPAQARAAEAVIATHFH